MIGLDDLGGLFPPMILPFYEKNQIALILAMLNAQKKGSGGLQK